MSPLSIDIIAATSVGASRGIPVGRRHRRGSPSLRHRSCCRVAPMLLQLLLERN